VAEAGHRDPCVRLDGGGETHQVGELRARHHDVLVELGQARVAQGVRELAAQLPQLLARFLVGAFRDRQGAMPEEDGPQGLQFGPDRLGRPVRLDDEVGFPGGQHVVAEVGAGRAQREGVGDLEGARQVAGIEHPLHAGRRVLEPRERGGQHPARRRARDQPQGSLGDDP